ncbi:Uncharacterised protein [BD1-7 clade bacterium]|uniref:Lcl C-terminal domain-containing protein n=1 Tax=BD1-7 clade bacterium TaxID=2029982 RepID=A0A5S9Q9D0_9GAMM|nr:Uncharacterised protein [BD1-7 clade bacterium]CAA0114088.1 Uncharacterised protein [BD1-7 clade bacterium]
MTGAATRFNSGNPMTSWQKTLLATAIITTTACAPKDLPATQPPTGGGGTDDSSTYGFVIDGYLQDATVCVDTNENIACDADEARQLTDNQGRFLKQSVIDKALLAQAKANTTRDLDDNALVQQDFVLMAPANHNGLITPLTTLLAINIDNGLSVSEARQALQNSLGYSADRLLADYIDDQDSDIALLAKTLVVTVQASAAEGMNLSPNAAAQKGYIEQKAWEKIDSSTLTALKQAKIDNPTADATALSTAWLAAVPAVMFSAADLPVTDSDNDTIPDSADNCPNIANTDQLNTDGDTQGNACDTDDDNDTVLDTADNCPLIANTDQADTDNDGIGSACDTSEATSDAFVKISITGQELANDATDYACVRQIKDADGNALANADQNTWMLLIPADKTFADLGYTPAGHQSTDLFWSYTWEPDASYPTRFKEANGLLRQYSNDDMAQHMLTLLNDMNYCGFADWTSPTVAMMETLNTSPLADNAAVKSIDTDVFKHHNALATQANARAETSDYLLKPYYWTNTRIVDADNEIQNGFYDFVKYLHPTAAQISGDEFTETPGAGPYFALRAVRNNRFRRVANDGSEVADSSAAWSCIIDSNAAGRTHWTKVIDNPTSDAYFTKEAANTHADTLNQQNLCGFSDWRLPTAEEFASLKPINSDYYFAGAKATDDEYFWLNVTDEQDDLMQLWRHSDSLSNSGYSSSTVRYAVYLRDDVAAGNRFDATVLAASAVLDGADATATSINAITVNTSADTADNISAAFDQTGELETLLTTLGEQLSSTLAQLTLAQSQYDALYATEKYAAREYALEDEQIRYDDLITDRNDRTTQTVNEWTALLTQYDNLTAATDLQKAIVLARATTAADNMSVLLTTLGADFDTQRSALDAANAQRKVELAALPTPIIPLPGDYLKVDATGAELSITTTVEQGWRCVKHSTETTDFRTVTLWTLLTNDDVGLAKETVAESRRDTLNTEALCGATNWALPTVEQLQALRTQDVDGQAEQTLDSAVFVNHSSAQETTPWYWTSSSYDAFRYANADNPENTEYRYSFSDYDDAMARFVSTSTEYIGNDGSCGDTKVPFDGQCFERKDTELTWDAAKAACEDESASLVSKNAYDEAVFSQLANVLELDGNANYWLLEEDSFPSYAVSLRETSSGWSPDNGSKNKSTQQAYVCQSAKPTSD